MKRADVLRILAGAGAALFSVVVFLGPFAFIFVTAAKTAPEASYLAFSWPQEWALWDNLTQVLQHRNGVVVRAFINSTILTVTAVSTMVVVSAMIGYVWQRRPSRATGLVNLMVLAKLIVPPAVVPTIWVLQSLHLFKTLPGLILVMTTFGMGFSVLLFRAFIANIPRELDEAATIDGAGPLRLFFYVILPLLRPVVLTIIVVQAVAVFNDFATPLYFLPGDANATVQLTLYNYMGEEANQWNLLMTNVLLITIPPLVLYLFFNRQIVAGMTSGAIKG